MSFNSLEYLLREAKMNLKSLGIPEYSLDAELIMMNATGMSRIDVLTNRSYILNDEETSDFLDKIRSRSNKEPIAYILGMREFMGLEFAVEKGVLIPRPDTEILVETVLEIISNYDKAVDIAEIGIGSGCISISLAKHSDAVCYGTDINPLAVKLAIKNAEVNNVTDRTHFYDGNLFEGLQQNMLFDIIVSNPPYIRKKDMEGLMPDVKNFEPENALCGGEDGLDFYRKIVHEGKKFLRGNGYMAFEIGFDEADEVREIFLNNGYTDVCVIKDLSGLDRVIAARMEV